MHVNDKGEWQEMAKEVRNSKGVKSSRDAAHAKSAKKSSGSRQQETKGHKMSAKKKAAKRRNRIILFALESSAGATW